MKAHRFLRSWLILVGLLVGSAFGLPPDQVVYYAIRVDPTNPKSRVQYMLSMALSAREEDGAWIGWSVENFTITEKAVLGGDTVWSVDFPFVDTSDGLWWVRHADSNEPIRSEFVQPAGVSGMASAKAPGRPDLYFSVVGAPDLPPAEGSLFEVTGALTYSFSTTSDPNDLPDDGGANEPVDIPLPPQDPPVSH